MNKTEHLLACLAEECAEVTHACMKALRFGLGDAEPGQPHTNAEKIIQEIADLYAVVELLEETGILRPRNFNEINSLMTCKKAKVEKFMAYARELGALRD